MISFATLSRTLLRLGLRRRLNVDQKQRRCIRLAVETLEDRIVPSTESLLSNLAVSGGVVSGVNTTLTIGQTLSLSVDVTAYPSAASPTPTGSVTFTLSVGMTEYTIGTVTLTSIGGYVAQADLVTSILPTTPDTYELSYTYYGDANYSGTNASDVAEITMEAPASGTPPNLAPSGGLGALPVPSGDVIASAPDTAITGVVYATGAISTSRTDLSSNGFGTPWGQDWVYSTQSGYTDGLSGSLANQAQPHLVSINSGTTIAVVAGTNAYFFDYYNDQFNARFGLDATLVHDEDDGQYVLNVDGISYAFNDFSDYDATAAAGSLLSVTDAYGDVTQATAWNGSGNVTTVEQAYGSGDTEQAQEFVTTYYSSGAAEGLVDTVTQETQTGTDGWNTVETATYAYYGSSSSNGLAGELMTAVVTDASDNILSAAYYRYYKGSGIGGGSPAEAGFLKYSFDTMGYEQLVAAYGSGLDALSNGEVSPYAAEAIQYDSGPVEIVGLSGYGSGTTELELGGSYTYTYTNNTVSNTGLLDPNVWTTETVEDMPWLAGVGGSDSNTVFTNAFGQVLLSVYTDYTTGDKWITDYRYNSQDQLVLVASPSAVTGYSTSYSDLVDWSGDSAADVSSTSGLITTYTYGSSTTATSDEAGNVANYLEETSIQQGTGGTSVPQESYIYISNAAGGVTVYKVAGDTVYSETGGDGAETTSYAYTFYSDTNAVYSVTTTLPVVSTDDNGSDSANTTETVYNQFGKPAWTLNPDGYIDYMAYDTFTGAVIETITDVNTSDSGDFSDLPEGWSTIEGAGLNLVTTYQVDSFGRDTKETDPDGNVTYWTYDDALMEVREYSGWVDGAETGPTQVTIDNIAGGYIDSFTMSATPAVSDGVPTGAEDIADIQSLTREWVNIGGQVTEEDQYFNLGGLTYGTSMGTSGVNYYATLYGYDTLGNQDIEVSPEGTIYLTVFDGQGRTVSTWVGTNDSDTDSNNMVETESFQYDGGGVGDGDLTQTIQYPDGDTGERVTDYWYDWRDEEVAEKQGVSEDEDDGVNRPLTVYTYDNLGEVIETQVYNGDGITPSIVDGELSLSDASSDLQAQTVMSYDSQGQVYQTQVYSVNPTNGDVSDAALTTNYYYDPDGNQVAESDPGGLWTKDVYNGAGEVVAEYQTDGGSGTSYSDAGTVSDDVVLTQTQYVYDADGNTIETITSDRFSTDSTTATGSLGTPTSGIGARVYYEGYYYDAAGRLTADVNVGTNGGSAWDMPSSPPSRSSTALVTTYGYAADAVQTVALTGTVTGGTFTLTFDGDTTSAIAYDASNATVESDLEALGDIGSGDVEVTTALGGGWEIHFTGSLAGTYENQLTGNGTDLDGTLTGIAIDTISLGGDAGNVSDTVDPDGIDDRDYYNPLGEVVQSIQDFTNGVITDDSNRTTDYTYNSIGETSLTAETGDGHGETTEWVYGVTTGTGSVIDSNDIVSATYQPNPSTGAPDSSLATTVTADALGETITSTDPNWTEQTYVYDVLGQQVADEVTSISGDSGIDGSVRQIGTSYTTLGQPQFITTYSVAGGGPDYIVNQVEDVYNGLGQLVQEYQSVSGAVGDDTPYVEYNYTDLGDGNNSRLTSIVYPDGYTVDYNYNAGLDSDIGRLSSISDFTGTLQSYQYLGLDTIVVIVEPEADLELTYLTTDDGTGAAGDEYTGLDQFGRVIEQNWYNTSTDTSMVDIQYGYDDDGNVLYQNNTLESTQSELFTYDGLGQLTSYEQGTLSDDNTVISSPSISETWGYDPLGNHLADSTTTIGTVTITSTFNYDNQITSISSGTTPTYDADGNMTTDQTGLKYTYNAWGQEVDVYSGDSLQENYTYDGLGDRMTNTVYTDDVGATTNFYNSTTGQVLEEQAAGTGYYTTRYVWSQNYVNQMVDRDTDTSGTGLTASGSVYARLWPVADANFNTVALVAMSGGSAAVLERYSYDPFGTATVMNGSYTVEDGSSYGWVYLFQGGRLDNTTGDTHFGARNLDAGLGTWTSEDPLGFNGGDDDLFRFESNHSTESVDPSGEYWKFTGITQREPYVPVWEGTIYQQQRGNTVVTVNRQKGSKRNDVVWQSFPPPSPGPLYRWQPEPGGRSIITRDRIQPPPLVWELWVWVERPVPVVKPLAVPVTVPNPLPTSSPLISSWSWNDLVPSWNTIKTGAVVVTITGVVVIGSVASGGTAAPALVAAGITVGAVAIGGSDGNGV